MEHVIIQSGPCGLFQVVHVLLTQSTRFVLAWTINFMMFGNFDPGWRCIPQDFSNFKDNVTDTSHIGKNNNATSLKNSKNSSYKIYNTATENNIALNNTNASSYMLVDDYDLYNDTLLGVTGSSTYSDTCDVIDSCKSIEFNPSSSTVVTEFGLVCDKTWVISFILSMQFIGMLTGSLFWGQIGERFGRKISVYCSTVTIAMCNALAVFCTSWEQYLVCSVFMGLGGVGILTCVPVYSMEFLSPKWRGMFASLPVWNLSSCCFAAIVILLKNWWHIHAVNAVLTTAVCLGYFWEPESPRWLAVNGKGEKAVKVIEKIARVNGKPIPNLEVLKKLTADENSNSSKTYTYLDLFRSKKIFIIIIKLSLSLVIAICTYNTLGFGVYSLPGNFYVNFIISSCSEIPAVILVGILANRIGRRWCAFVFSFIQTLCFCVIIFTTLAVKDTTVSDVVVKVMAFVARGGAVSVLSIISPIAVELLPTVVRSVGLGFILMVSRLGGMVAPFLLPHDQTSFIVCFVVLAVAGVVACLDFLSLPETNRKPLPDTMREREISVQVGDSDGGEGGDDNDIVVVGCDNNNDRSGFDNKKDSKL